MGAAHATTHQYRVVPGPFIQNVNGQILVASLAEAKSNDQWQAGDTVICEPGVYATGALTLDQTDLTLQAAGCTLDHPGNGPLDGTLRITAGGVQVNGPLTLRNTGAGGYVISIDSAQGAIGDFLVRDVLIDQTAPGGISPIRIQQSSSTLANSTVSGAFVRVRLLAGTGKPDGFGIGHDPSIGAPPPSGTGTIWLIDCEADGCDQLGNSNAVAVDSRALAVVIGGSFSNSGGPNLIGASSLFGRMFAFGAHSRRGNTAPGAVGSNADLQAEIIENCLIEEAITGVALIGPIGGRATGILRNTTVRRDPNRAAGGTSATTVSSFGVRVVTPLAILENSVIEGWRYAAVDDVLKTSTAVAVEGGHGGSCLLRDCWLKDCYFGVVSWSWGGVLVDLQRCLITGTPGLGANWSTAVRVIAAAPRVSTLRMANTVICWEPATGNQGTIISMSDDTSAQDPLGGRNYLWSNSNIYRPFDGAWQEYATDYLGGGPAVRPIFDESGKQVIGSPAYYYSKYDMWSTFTFNRGRTGLSTTAAGMSQRGRFTTTLTEPDGWWENQTLQFLSGLNAGQWRRISGYSQADGLIEVSPELVEPPFENDLFVIRAPALPSSGTTNAIDPTYSQVESIFNDNAISATGQDCNLNGVPDAIDVSGATSLDCDADGVPDECQPDCNTDGVPDNCQLTHPAGRDCDGNGVPDECDVQLAVADAFFDGFAGDSLDPLHWAAAVDAEPSATRFDSAPRSVRLIVHGSLESAPIDLSAAGAISLRLRAAAAGRCAGGDLQISYWDGSAWQLFAVIVGASEGFNWRTHEFTLPAAAMHAGSRIRIAKVGLLQGAWFIDDIAVRAPQPDCDSNGFQDACEFALQCNQPADPCATCAMPTRGDLNCDAQVDVDDLCAFVPVLLWRGPLPADESYAADVNADEAVDGADVSAMVNLIAGS